MDTENREYTNVRQTFQQEKEEVQQCESMDEEYAPWGTLKAQYRPDPSTVYWAYRPMEDEGGQVLGVKTSRAFPSTAVARSARKRPFPDKKSFHSMEEIVEVSSSDDDSQCVYLVLSEGELDGAVDEAFSSSSDEEDSSSQAF